MVLQNTYVYLRQSNKLGETSNVGHISVPRDCRSSLILAKCAPLREINENSWMCGMVDADREPVEHSRSVIFHRLMCMYIIFSAFADEPSSSIMEFIYSIHGFRRHMWAILFFMGIVLRFFSFIVSRVPLWGRMRTRPFLISGACKLKNTRVRSLFIWLLRLYSWSRTNACNMHSGNDAYPHNQTNVQNSAADKEKGRGKRKMKSWSFIKSYGNVVVVVAITFSSFSSFRIIVCSAMYTRTLRVATKSLKEFSFAWIASTMARKAIKYLNAAT